MIESLIGAVEFIGFIALCVFAAYGAMCFMFDTASKRNKSR